MEFIFKSELKRPQSKKLKYDLYSSEELLLKMKNYTLKGHQGCVNTVQWNEDGTLLVSGSDDCCLNIWRPLQQKLVLNIFTGHSGNIFCGKFLPNTSDTQLISCAADSEIRHIDISSSKPVIKEFLQHEGMVKKLQIDPKSSNCFYSCSMDGTIRFFDLRMNNNSNGKIIVDLRTQNSRMHRRNRTVDINSISINPLNPDLFICAGGDPYVRLYDRRMNKIMKRYAPTPILQDLNDDAHITCVRYNSNGDEFLATYSEEKIYLFNENAKTFESNKFVEEIKIEEPKTEPNEISDEEEEQIHLTPQNPNNNIDPYANIKEGELVTDYLKCYSGHRNVRTIKEVNFYGPRNEYVISGSDCGNIFFWNKKTSKIVNIVKGDKKIVNCLSPHPLLHPIIATSGIENDIKIWEPLGGNYSGSLMDKKEEIIEKNSSTTQNEHFVTQNELLNLMILLSRNRQNAQDLFELFQSEEDSSEEN